MVMSRRERPRNGEGSARRTSGPASEGIDISEGAMAALVICGRVGSMRSITAQPWFERSVCDEGYDA